MSSYIAAFVLGILIYEWLQRGAAGAEAAPTSQGYRYPAGKPFRILWTGAVMVGVVILVLAPWTNDPAFLALFGTGLCGVLVATRPAEFWTSEAGITRSRVFGLIKRHYAWKDLEYALEYPASKSIVLQLSDGNTIEFDRHHVGQERFLREVAQRVPIRSARRQQL